MPSLVIRNGTIVDGSGGTPFEADIAIEDGRITQVGVVTARGAEEIDAKGMIVTPGFVDIHTHYDAQATWSSHLDSSSLNGVTTVLIGNCGVGFAPCRPGARDALVKLMEGVEDLPEVVLTEGLPWNWESFPQFLDVLGARQYDMDIATQVTHAPLRVHVMGDRAAAYAEATPAECEEMARLAAEGIRAGALGFSTSRAIAHKTLDGTHTPTLGTPEAELETIGRAVGEAGASWLQVISDFDEPEDEFARLQRIAAASGKPMTFSLLQRESRPWLWRFLLEKVEAANAAGIPMTGQVMGRPVGLMFGFELSQHPFVARPAWKEVAHLPFAEKMAAIRAPGFKERILAEDVARPGAAGPDEHLVHDLQARRPAGLRAAGRDQRRRHRRGDRPRPGRALLGVDDGAGRPRHPEPPDHQLRRPRPGGGAGDGGASADPAGPRRRRRACRHHLRQLLDHPHAVLLDPRPHPRRRSCRWNSRSSA